MIGLGEIAYKASGEAVQQSHNAEMIVGMDVVEHVARSYQERYEIPCSTNLDDVLKNPDVDAVIISTPHYTHAPLGIAAAKAGKHVMVEKPFVLSLAEADELIETCKKNGVLCSCCLVSRYNPDAQKAKELIEKGTLGKIMALEFFGVSNKPKSYWTGGYTNRVQTTWRKSKKESGGGILIMNFVHDIDRLRYITGLEATRVFCEYDTFNTETEVEDFITVTMRYSNGALGTLLAASCVPGAQASGIRGAVVEGNRIYGTAGQIIFGRKMLVYTDKEVEGLKKGEWNEITFESVGEQRSAYIDEFADSVFTGKPVKIPGEEGRKTLEVMLAAYKSGETHKPVTLPLK